MLWRSFLDELPRFFIPPIIRYIFARSFWSCCLLALHSRHDIYQLVSFTHGFRDVEVCVAFAVMYILRSFLNLLRKLGKVVLVGEVGICRGLWQGPRQVLMEPLI